VHILHGGCEACGDGATWFVGDQRDVFAGFDAEAGFDGVLCAREQVW
jgi:hypothetical protein